MKFEGKLTNKTLREGLQSTKIVWVMVFIMILLCMNVVSALEFDNSKSLKEIGRAGYPNIEIKNAFGLGSTLWSGELTRNTDSCSERCSAENTITIYKEGSLIDDVRFETITETDRYEQPIRSYQFYIKSGEKWIEYSLGQEVPAGTYEVKLEGKKKPSRTVDWQIKSEGIWIDDWAVWGATENEGLVGYWTMNETTGDVIDSVGTNDGRIIGSVGRGVYTILNNSLIWTDTDGSKVNISSNNPAYDTLSNFSVSFWMNSSFDATERGILWRGNPITNAQRPWNIWTQSGVFYYSQTNSADQEANAVSATCATPGTIYHYVIARNDSAVIVYCDGVQITNTTSAMGDLKNYDSDQIIIGEVYGSTSKDHDGQLDELGFWNRTLTQDEVTRLYNGGAGLQYPFNAGIVTLTSPGNNHISMSENIELNCSAVVTGASLVNMSLLTNETGTWKINQTFSKTGVVNSSAFDISSISGFSWTCQACDSDGDCGFASENRTILIDTNAPSIVPLNSTFNYHQNGFNLTLSMNISDTNLDSCWYDYSGTNTTFPCANNYTSFNITSYSNRSIYLYANDTAGNLNTTYWTWNYKVFGNSLDYNPTAYSTSDEAFILNITYNYLTYNVGGQKLLYNGTEYPVNFQGSGGNRILNSSVTIPSTTGTKTFWFNFTIDGEEVSTPIYSQTVLSPAPITVSTGVCGAGLSPAFYFDFADATNRTAMSSSANYNFKYGYSGDTTGLLEYGNLTNVLNFTICINVSSPDYSVGYGEVQYYQTNYNLRHFYIFDNTRLTNQTVNNTLYLVPTTSTYEFTISIQDSLYRAQSDKYVSLLKWYPEINEYKIVEMGLTDELGQTVFSLITGTVDYRIGVYETDGTLIHLTNPSRFVCASSPCSHTVTIPPTSTGLSNFYGIQSSLTFNSTSNIFTYIWNDPSQATTGMNLTVYRDSYGDSIIVCSSSASTWTGVLTCDVSAYTGTMRAVVYRSASPFKEFANLLVTIGGQISSVAGGKTIGLFMGVVLLVFAFLAGIFNPVVAIILGVVSMIPMLYFGVIGKTVFIGILLLGGIVIHFMRRS